MNGDRIPIVDDDKAPRDTLRRLFAHEGRVGNVASCVTETPAKLDPTPFCDRPVKPFLDVEGGTKPTVR